VASPGALQALTSLTCLTWLDLGNTAVSAGLQQLTSLKGLACLRLDECKGVTDEHLQPLSALTGLTSLEAGGTGVQGSSLAGLTSLRYLGLPSCSNLDAAGLAAVAQLTRLTFLELFHRATAAQPAQPAQLAQLTNLQDLRLWGHTIRDQAAALLQLPRLGQLCANSITVPQGQDVSGCAITRLVLEMPTAAGLQTLPRLPALQSLRISTAGAGLTAISMQTQLTELAVGGCEGVQASELAAALRGLKQLQALELGHAGCFDMECLRAVSGLPQLQELWLDGGAEGLAPGMGDCWGMLHRGPQLQRVTLQRCSPISKGALVSLVTQLGMQQVVLCGAHGLAAEAVSELQELGTAEGCELLCEEEVCPGPLCDEYFNIPV
jgi:Leucine-rich repeat (LRR) protein